MKCLVLGRVAAALVAICSLAPVAGKATTFEDVRVNAPQISGDPGSDTTALFPVNRQNEPTIAVNPADPAKLIAGANDMQRNYPCNGGYCGSYLDIGRSGVYTSSDGGATWTNQGVLSDSAGWGAAPFYPIGDPVLSFGPKPTGTGTFSYANGARAYYATLAFYKYGLSPYPSNDFKAVIVVSYSDDDGVNWSAPTVVESRDNARNFNDKEWIAADSNPASPYFGRVYVSWTDFRSDSNNQAEPIMFAASMDGGLTFGTSQQLSSASNPAGPGNGRQDTVIATGPDGSVYVAWADSASALVAISRNGGKRFGKPVKMGTFSPIDDPIPGATFRTGDPDLKLRLGLGFAADPRPGSSVLYAAWISKTASVGRVMVSKSTSRGSQWSAPVAVSTVAEGYAFFPSIDVAPNGRVDVGYLALTTVDPGTVGTGNALIDAFYVLKPAVGSWSSPLKVSSQSSDPAVSAQGNLSRQFWGDYTTIRSGANKAWFIYTDGRNGAGCAAVDAYQLGALSFQPDPPVDCPTQFGNTDIYVSIVQP